MKNSKIKFYIMLIINNVFKEMYQAKTCTNTNILQYAKLKARKSLYLVLKKKPFAKEIVEELNEEVERRLTNFIEKLVKKMEERQNDDPEKLLKYTILKAIVRILDNIMKENYIQMTEDDKAAVEIIFGDGDDSDDNDDYNANFNGNKGFHDKQRNNFNGNFNGKKGFHDKQGNNNNSHKPSNNPFGSMPNNSPHTPIY